MSGPREYSVPTRRLRRTTMRTLITVRVAMPHGLPYGEAVVDRAQILNMVTPDHVPKMRLVAYVSERGEVHHQSEDGFGSFSHVFHRRPADFRYAVTEIANPRSFMLIDLYDLQTDKSVSVLEPGWSMTFDDLDGALMAGVLMRRAQTP